MGDGTRLAVEWEGPFEAPRAPVTLRIELENARLFAIWCEQVPAPSLSPSGRSEALAFRKPRAG